MSFFSLSLPSGRSRHRNGNYGSDYYKRRGLLGNLLNGFSSSGRHGGYYDYPPAPYPYPPNPQMQQPNPQMQTPPPASTTACVSCNAQIPKGSKFCLNCGERVSESAYCPNCGEALLPNARFCQKCGVKVNQ